MENNKLYSTCSNMTFFFLAIIVMLNAVRCVFYIHDQSILIYGIYLGYIFFSFLTYRKRLLKLKKNDLPIVILLTLMILYSFFTSIVLDTISYFFKFFIFYLLFYSILIIDIKNIKKITNYIIHIGNFFLLYTIFFPNLVQNYMINGSNYLLVTLPIGLLATLHLVNLLFSFYNRNTAKTQLYHLLFSILCFYTLSQFLARSSILFPLFVMFIVFLLLFYKNKKMVIFGIFLFIIGIMFYNIYINNASEYGIQRMENLFLNFWEEDRWVIWKDYISWVIKNYAYIIGAGTNSSNVIFYYYPHNIFLQLIGEYGFLGIIFLIEAIHRVASIVKKYFFKQNKITNDIFLVFINVFSGFLFFLFNFLKSFSLYDAAPFFIYLALLISIGNKNEFWRNN